VDELTPQLDALVKAIEKVKLLVPRGGDSSAAADTSTALVQWVKELQQMRASEEIDEDQARQLQYDLNSAKTVIDEMLS
jgi:hypothetical protein